MTVFSERSHAFIAMRYYQLLEEKFNNKGILAFNHGTQYYAAQRGRRMAQRAIRDGKELTYETYCQYGEWVNTDYTINDGSANKSTLHSNNPDFDLEVLVCPWHVEFKDAGEVEGGYWYCKYLDESIARGFNPDIDYKVSQTLHKNESCLHLVKNVYFDDNTDLKKRPENLQGFEYHCAHSYWSYNEVVEAIFGLEGKIIATQVLEDFANKYGKDNANILMKYKYTNFNVTF